MPLKEKATPSLTPRPMPASPTARHLTLTSHMPNALPGCPASSTFCPAVPGTLPPAIGVIYTSSLHLLRPLVLCQLTSRMHPHLAGESVMPQKLGVPLIAHQP
ncbi:unnamed protein product, partial [Ilex paraguariensis]